MSHVTFVGPEGGAPTGGERPPFAFSKPFAFPKPFASGPVQMTQEVLSGWRRFADEPVEAPTEPNFELEPRLAGAWRAFNTSAVERVAKRTASPPKGQTE